jgi:transposase
MAEAYAVELRERVVGAYEAGDGSYQTLAKRFSIGEATVKRWVWLKQERGDVLPQRKRGGTPSTIVAAELASLIAELGDPTAPELTVRFNRSRRGSARVHVSSMKRALHRCGYVVKKSADGHWRVCAPT